MWDEFCATAAYLTNFTGTTANDGKTPYELWHGKLPSLSHLREIGCCAYALIPTHNLKVYHCSIPCILIGYAPRLITFGIRLLTAFLTLFMSHSLSIASPLPFHPRLQPLLSLKTPSYRLQVYLLHLQLPQVRLFLKTLPQLRSQYPPRLRHPQLHLPTPPLLKFSSHLQPPLSSQQSRRLLPPYPLLLHKILSQTTFPTTPLP